MARKKKPEPEAQGDTWLNTYADMVTLLLCFFVMMYTASTPDEAKMQWILRSFKNLSGSVVNPVATDPVEKSTDNEEDNAGPDTPEKAPGEIPGVPGDMPMTFDDLFNWVDDTIIDNKLESFVSVSESNGRLYIRFDSDIMFDGNSYELRREGIDALNKFSPGIKAVREYIASVHVEGHTAPQPDGRRRGIDDWFLSSMRSVSVVNHLDYGLDMVEPEKFRVIGDGQYSPYYSTETADSNAKNRRVELVITRNRFNEQDTDKLLDILAYDYENNPIPGGDASSRSPSAEEYDRQAQIMARIKEKYGNPPEDLEPKLPEGVKPPSEWGPVVQGIPEVASKEE